MRRQPGLFDDAAKGARDEALKVVADNSGLWFDLAFHALCQLGSGHERTGEEIRLLIARAVGRPHHHNAWGALIRVGIGRGVLKPTGAWRSMQTEASHARRTPVYRIR